jgi:phosphoglycerate dehydrogenase-like enzyme
MVRFRVSLTRNESRPQIAEWVIGTWLSHVHSLNRYARDQLNEVWKPLVDFNAFGTDSVGRRMYVSSP